LWGEGWKRQSNSFIQRATDGRFKKTSRKKGGKKGIIANYSSDSFPRFTGGN